MEIKAFYEFVNAINEHNVANLYPMMTDDHMFVDAQGNEVSGKDKMKVGWTVYFQWFPDYKVEIISVFSDGDIVAAFGFASGTFKGIKTDKNENFWRLPAAWKVLVRDNKIKLWQVYADTKIPYDIINKNKQGDKP
jgi:ketosteroid isomerase-like protein